MREISLHLLDIAENSVAAGASSISIGVEEDYHKDLLAASVIDNGKGMDPDTAEKVMDPFFTSRTTRNVGLGIPLFKAAAEACDGQLNIFSTPGIGTTITITFKLSHIDRMPLGDLSSTFLSLLIAYPKIHWTFLYKVYSNDQADSGKEFFFDDTEVKNELQDVSLCDPEILKYFRQIFETGILETKITQ